MGVQFLGQHEAIDMAMSPQRNLAYVYVVIQ